MRIEELREEDSWDGENESILANCGREIGLLDAKRVVVGAGARILFYPTLLYNVIRNKIEPGFHWWDRVDEFLLLGAVPFPNDVPHLKQLGVHGVITLNEPYETLVPSSLYFDYGIEHLVIPTRDYLFAPSFGDICRAVDFIHMHASSGKTTYVHCKAGRGRSTTIVLCYLVEHKQMTPNSAFEYVRLSRPRVLLASSQWKAVQEYYHFRVKKTGRSMCLDNPVSVSPAFVATQKLLAIDDSSFVVISESDLDGYDGDIRLGNVGKSIWAEVSLVYRVQLVGQAALGRFSCFWLQCQGGHERISPDNLRRESCSLMADKLGGQQPCLLKGVVVRL